MAHKAGFISIVGKPNAGKSTLMNILVGERLSIITPKAQTTRHKILGIVNSEDYQIIFCDTPGVIEPKYALHEAMLNSVKEALDGIDLALLVTDINEQYDEEDVLTILEKVKSPIVIIINKVDESDEKAVKDKIEYWQKKLPEKPIIPISALHHYNIESIWDEILKHIPEHPAYYDKDSLTDRPERFFVSEIVREKIFQLYQKEIPYSSEVVVTSFKEESNIVKIYTEIIVERDSQKNILIGAKGSMLKKVGILARKDIETFLQKPVYLDLFVKVLPDWRNKNNYLKRFGYEN